MLRAFAEEGDRLWLPAPIAAERIPEIEGLPRPVLETGPLERLPPAGSILAWGETPGVALLRGATAESFPSHQTAATVHHRAFCLQVAQTLDLALPGARMVEELADLDRLLTTPDAPCAWVLKAPLSAAGRDRHIERNGPALTDPAARRAVAGLFARAGSLLFEPWMDRTADYGCSALLSPDGTFDIVSFHSQAVDRRGQFAGIELPGHFEGITGLSQQEEDRMRAAIEGAARALAGTGYRGPFGIDAWRYRTGDGGTAFHPLGEINARMTFGLVARTLVDRLAPSLGLVAEDRIRLAFGRALPENGIPLVTPDRQGRLAIWLEREKEKRPAP